MTLVTDYSFGVFRYLLVQVRRVLSSVRRFCSSLAKSQRRVSGVDRYHRQPVEMDEERFPIQCETDFDLLMNDMDGIGYV
ncbi:hypothetical protein ACROYT_G002161 [Oculina patagonica]